MKNLKIKILHYCNNMEFCLLHKKLNLCMGTTPQPPCPSCPAHISGIETGKFTHKRWAPFWGGNLANWSYTSELPYRTMVRLCRGGSSALLCWSSASDMDSALVFRSVLVPLLWVVYSDLHYFVWELWHPLGNPLAIPADSQFLYW